MAIGHDSTRGPRRPAMDQDELLASAVTLVCLARAPGRARLALGARLASTPFLYLTRTAAAPDAAGAAEGAPLLWALLPLASLLPWMSTMDTGQPVAAPAIADSAVPGTEHSAPPSRRAANLEDRPTALGPLPLRDGGSPPIPALARGLVTWPVPTPATGVLPIAIRERDNTDSPPPRLPEPSPHTGRTGAPGVAEAAQGRASQSPSQPVAAADAAAAASIPAAASRGGPTPGVYTWNAPLVARLPRESPPGRSAAVEGPAQPLPEPAPPRPATLDVHEPALAFARPVERDAPPQLRARLPATALSFPQVVEKLRSIVKETVVEEVARSVARRAPTPPPERAPEALAEVYTEQSVRKIMAKMRRIEQEERNRRGAG